MSQEPELSRFVRDSHYEPKTQRDVEIHLDQVVDRLAILIEQGVKEGLGLTKKMHEKLKTLHRDTFKVYCDWLFATGKIDQHGNPVK